MLKFRMDVRSDIKTFVFLDLETTGLPHEEYNKTKITELCLIGVKSQHLNASRKFPRVTQKINLCFYPQKMISYVSEKITGLSNDLLEFEPRFQKEAVNVIIGFLNLLEKPICFVAHNGNNFDFPILKAEIYKTGNELGDDILCIDSLLAFKELYEEDANKYGSRMCEPSSQQNISEEMYEVDEVISGTPKKMSIDKIQMVNETTPTKQSQINQCDSPATSTNYATISINDLYYTSDMVTVNQAVDTNSPSNSNKVNVSEIQFKRKIPSARKQLNFGIPSFKLVDVYEMLTKKKSMDAHRAEQDVLMLIECVTVLGRRLTEWANRHAVKFSDVPKMVPGRKIGT